MYSAVDFDAHPSLRTMLGPLVEQARAVDYFSIDGRAYARREADGFLTLRVGHDHGAFAVVCTDFRLRGGSFGRENSARLSAFIDAMGAEGLPMVFLVDSMGVRLMEGRSVVGVAFGMLPHLLRYREHQPLITCNLERALGLGAVVLGAGHYRLAVAGRTVANLAGPEIMRQFFGEASDFERAAMPENQPPGATLVNELSPTRRDMLAKGALLARCASGAPPPPAMPGVRPDFPDLGRRGLPEEKLTGIVAALTDSAEELFGCLSPSVRTYLASRRGRRFGLLINPPGNPDNLITAAVLEKYILALDFFRALRLPAVSFIDTPGGDPRDHSDVILKLWQASQRIIDYPHGLMGMCIGRGYGGAIVLGFPRFFGSTAAYILEGATVGLMHPQLIDSLLASSKSLAADWALARSTQTADCADLLRAGIIDAKLRPEEVLPALDRFLAAPGGGPRQPGRAGRIASGSRGERVET